MAYDDIVDPETPEERVLIRQSPILAAPSIKSLIFHLLPSSVAVRFARWYIYDASHTELASHVGANSRMMATA